MLKKLLEGNNLRAPTPFDAGMEEFLPVDIQQLARRLEIDKKAHDRGGKNLPPTDQEIADDIELSIESEIGNFSRRAHAALSDYLKTYRERVASLLASDTPDRISNIAKTTSTQMFAQVRTGTGILFSAKSDLVKASRDLRNFMKARGISEPASYPENRFLLFSILVLLIVFESAANAVLIGEASEFGILGGFAEMIGISFINLTVGFAVGHFLLPQLTRKNFFVKVFFGLVALTAICGILGFNLFVGHYRDVIATSASDLGIVDFGARAVRRLVEDPIGLQDFKSWVFMILGIIFSSFALIDGLKWDDIHPGYGPRDRMSKKLVLKYGRDFERLQNELGKLSESGIQEINEVAERASYHEQELKAIQERVVSLREKLTAYYAQLERDGQQLVQRYRQENIAARTDAPPAYFNTKFSIPEQDRVTPSLDLGDAIDPQIVMTSASAARASIQETYRELLQVYKTIDHLSDSETWETKAQSFVERVKELEENSTIEPKQAPEEGGQT